MFFNLYVILSPEFETENLNDVTAEQEIYPERKLQFGVFRKLKPQLSSQFSTTATTSTSMIEIYSTSFDTPTPTSPVQFFSQSNITKQS